MLVRADADDVDGAAKCAKHEAEVKRLKSTNSDLNVSIDQLRTENKQLSSEMAQLNQKVKRHETELEKSYKENGELKAEIQTKENELENQKRTITEELTKNHEQLTRKNSELEMAKEKLRKVEESERKLQAALADKDKELKMQYYSSTKMSNGLEARLADKDKKIADIECQLQTVQTQNKDLSTRLHDKEQEIAELHNTIRDMPTGRDAETNTEAENVESQVSLSEVESTLEATRDDVTELNQLTSLQTLNEDLLMQLQDKEQQIAQLYDTIHRLNEDTESSHVKQPGI